MGNEKYKCERRCSSGKEKGLDGNEMNWWEMRSTSVKGDVLVGKRKSKMEMR